MTIITNHVFVDTLINAILSFEQKVQQTPSEHIRRLLTLLFRSLFQMSLGLSHLGRYESTKKLQVQREMKHLAFICFVIQLVKLKLITLISFIPFIIQPVNILFKLNVSKHTQLSYHPCFPQQEGSAFQLATSSLLKKRQKAIYRICYLLPVLPIAGSQEAIMYEICQCQFPS